MSFRCFQETKLKTRWRCLPLAIFVCLYQQNLFWYHRSKIVPPEAKMHAHRELQMKIVGWYLLQRLLRKILCYNCGWGCRFLRWWSPSTMSTDPLFFLSTTTGNVRIIPYFQIWGYVLHVQHASSQIVANTDESSLFLSQQFVCLAGGKHHQKIAIPIFRLVLQNFVPGCFLVFFSIVICSPYFLLVGLSLQSAALFQSRN